jgi:type I restriction enzyme, S subunit
MNRTEEYTNHGLTQMDTNEKKLPEGWEWRKLSELFTIRPQKKIVKEKLDDDDVISFVPMDCLNVYNRNLTLNQTRTLKDVYSGYTYFEDNDVLLAKITPCFENGKVGIARNLKNGIGFGSSEFIVFRSQGKVIPEYLYYYLSQDSFRQEGKAMMAGAVGHKRVQKEFINEYQLPFPESKQEQKRIVAQLDKLSYETEQLESIYHQKIIALDKLKKSILKKAFEGEL